MKILVSFKIVTDPDRVLEEDFADFRPGLDLGYAGADLNCFDQSALELALKLRQEAAVQEEISCTALTVSEDLSEDWAQRLYSIGFDRVLRIPSGGEFQPEKVAGRIAEAAVGYDLILMGREAGMGESGMVPWLVAQKLGLPVVCGVEDGSWDQGLKLKCREQGNLWERKVRLPVLAVVDNSPLVLRAATLRQRMKCRGRGAEVLPGQPGTAPEGLSFQRPSQQRQCRMLEPSEETFSFLRQLFEDAAKAKIDRKPNEKREMTENPALRILPDNEAGRAEAVKLIETGRSCRFDCEVMAVEADTVTVRRLVFGSNLELTEKLPLPAVFTCPDCEAETEAPARDWVLSQTLVEENRDFGLSGAPLVFACGNGMGSRENCELARAAAKRFGAGFGLTRPGALNAWGSTQEILGQSGLQIRPRCCLTLGAAGAGAFLLGIRGAETIVAVNTDPNALIFKSADYGICMDAVEFLKKLEGR